MNKVQHSHNKLVSALIVAVGLAALWGTSSGWLLTFANRLLASSDEVVEEVNVAQDGTPVIAVNSSRRADIVLSYRTIDGKAWPEKYDWWLYPAYLFVENPPGVVRLPRQWDRRRIAGISDGRPSPTAWYLVEQPLGQLYLAGFDGRTKLPVGFLGTNGFRETIPVPKERFTSGEVIWYRVATIFTVATSGFLQSGELVQHFSTSREQGELPTSLLFVIDGDRICELDLRQRTVREFAEVQGLTVVQVLRALRSTVRGTQSQAINQRRIDGQLQFVSNQAPNSLIPNNAVDDDAERQPTTSVLVARAKDRICIIDPTDQKTREFKLPSDLRAPPFLKVYWPQPDRLLIEQSDGYWAEGSIVRLSWLTPDGTIERQERLELRGYVSPSLTQRAWRGALTVPVPLVWIIGLTAWAPLAMMQANQVDSFAAGLQSAIQIGWLPLVTIMIIALILCGLMLRQHRRYFRSSPWTWLMFVGLLGVPGLLAYLIEFRRPKFEACSNCAAPVPRDRTACAACDTTFPEPPLVGTEIFSSV